MTAVQRMHLNDMSTEQPNAATVLDVQDKIMHGIKHSDQTQ